MARERTGATVHPSYAHFGHMLDRHRLDQVDWPHRDYDKIDVAKVKYGDK